MFHEPNSEIERDHATAAKGRLGIILFFAYFVVYGGFVAIGILKPQWLGEKMMSQTLAVIYGMGLILLAIVMGVVYHMICNSYEKQSDHQKENK